MELAFVKRRRTGEIKVDPPPGCFSRVRIERRENKGSRTSHKQNRASIRLRRIGRERAKSERC